MKIDVAQRLKVMDIEKEIKIQLWEQRGTTTSVLHFVVSTNVGFGNFDQINQWASKQP
jgi:hypothetical protein